MLQHRAPSDLESKLDQPWKPRANLAISVDKPDGSTEGDWASRHRNQSVLEQHCAFFDPDRDGGTAETARPIGALTSAVIWPLDTFRGFHALGYHLVWSVVAVFVIHSAFSYFSLPRHQWLPDPLFRIYLQRINRCKHGSDTGTYDAEGRFVPSKVHSSVIAIGQRARRGPSSALRILDVDIR